MDAYALKYLLMILFFFFCKAKNKMPSLSGSFSDLVERDVSEPTAVGKTSKLISEEGKEQEKKECTAKVGSI